ncbi:MAG: DUF2796 domain-containing protein [Pseudomonadota bacterium]
MRRTIQGLVIGTCALAMAAGAATAGSGHKHGHSHGHKEEKKEQHAAHTHGEGALNIAVQGKTVAVELEIPADSVVGFEHAAKSAEDKKAVKGAVAKLEEPLKLFKPTAAANCTVAKTDVELEGALAGEGGSHSSIHAKYELSCANPAALTSVTIDLFDAFPKTEKIEVSLVGPKGARKFEATPKSRVMETGGTS